jgi:hypothetical protein
MTDTRTSSPDGDKISWYRVAEPQPDRYDALVALEFARRGGYERKGPGDAETICDGRVALLRQKDTPSPFCIPAPHDHPNIEGGCKVLRMWPAGYAQFQLLIESVSVFLDSRFASMDQLIGSSSHHGEGGFPTIAATVNNPVGFAEALVHELAHHKLRALGVDMESASRIVTNSPDQMFRSPVRYDILRPIPAILQAQYAYTYVAALDLAVVKATDDPDLTRRIAVDSLSGRLPKLRFGLNVLREHAEVDEAGAGFMQGLFAWSDRLFAECAQFLADLRVPERTFTHPLDVLPDKYPYWKSTITQQDLLEEMLLYTPETERAFALNGSAKAIWELCNGGHTVLQISRELGERFGCRDEELLPDVMQAVFNLNRYGLLNLADRPHATASLG